MILWITCEPIVKKLKFYSQKSRSCVKLIIDRALSLTHHIPARESVQATSSLVTRAIFRDFPSFRRFVATRSGADVSALAFAEGRRWTTVNRASVWRQTAAMGTEWVIAGEKPRPVSEAGLSRSRSASLRRCWRFPRCDDPPGGLRSFRCRSRRGLGGTGRSRFGTPDPGGHTPPGSQSEPDIQAFHQTRFR